MISMKKQVAREQKLGTMGHQALLEPSLDCIWFCDILNNQGQIKFPASANNTYTYYR